jgi:hypothetical protein
MLRSIWITTLLLIGGAAFAEEPKATPKLLIHRGDHRSAYQPDAQTAAPIEGDRGCTFAAQSDCAPWARVTELTRDLTAGDQVVVAVDGEGIASMVTVARNGQVVFSKENVTLPFELPEMLVVEADDLIDMSVTTADGISFLSARATASTSTTRFDNQVNVLIRYFVAHNGSLAEVVTNSGTGGRFFSRSPFCVIAGTPVSACPAGFVVRFYTDRASRGEVVLTRLDGGAGLSNVFVQVSGRIVVGPISIGLPFGGIIPRQVSINPNDDNIVILVQSQGILNSRRVPVGTRP